MKLSVFENAAAEPENAANKRSAFKQRFDLALIGQKLGDFDKLRFLPI